MAWSFQSRHGAPTENSAGAKHRGVRMRAGIFAAAVALAALSAGCGGGATAGAPGAKGTSVYVLGPGTNGVLTFNENTSGALVPIQGSSSAPTGSVPVSMAVHPSGKITFIANNADGTITILARNTGNGVLSVPPLPTGALNQPPPIMAGTNPVAMSITPTGNFLYVLNQGSNNISAFSVDVQHPEWDRHSRDRSYQSSVYGRIPGFKDAVRFQPNDRQYRVLCHWNGWEAFRGHCFQRRRIARLYGRRSSGAVPLFHQSGNEFGPHIFPFGRRNHN